MDCGSENNGTFQTDQNLPDSQKPSLANNHPNIIQEVERLTRYKDKHKTAGNEQGISKSGIKGICSREGNLVFTDTPVMAPVHTKTDSHGVYKVPVQHPLYTTTIGDYGLPPCQEHLPCSFHPRDSSFTASNLGFNYLDSHFNTDLNSSSQYTSP